MQKVVVFGAGVMGAGIAQVFATAGCQVTSVDISEEVLNSAKAEVDTGRFGLQSAVERGKLNPEEAKVALENITFAIADSADTAAALAEADLILEAIPERFDIKIQLFRDLEQKISSECILASNSSGFSVSALGAATNRPELVVGWHWASPAPVMKLAEIVKGRATSEATIEKVCELAKAAGKNPIVIKDTDQHWGYVTNRIYFAMIAAANQVVDEGIASREQVDQLMIDCFRWPTGPFGMVAGAGGGWKKE